MIARRFGLLLLAASVSLVWTGCRPAVRPPVGSQKGRPPAQEKAGRKFVRSRANLDDNAIRARLLVAEVVQKDLGLTGDQIGKVREYVKIGGQLWREFLFKWHEIFPPPGRFPQEEFEARQRKFRTCYADYQGKAKELQTKLLAMLTPSQIERLKQIQFQAAIPTALAKPEIIKALAISEEQQGKIGHLCDHLGTNELAQFPDLRGLDPKERRQKSIEFMKECDKLRAEATKPVLEVLTPEQRAKFDKSLGKKIELTWPYDELIPEDAESWPPFGPGRVETRP